MEEAITANSTLLTPNYLEDVIESDEHLEFLSVTRVYGATHINAENHVAVHDDFQAGACSHVDTFFLTSVIEGLFTWQGIKNGFGSFHFLFAERLDDHTCIEEG